MHVTTNDAIALFTRNETFSKTKDCKQRHNLWEFQGLKAESKPDIEKMGTFVITMR